MRHPCRIGKRPDGGQGSAPFQEEVSGVMLCFSRQGHLPPVRRLLRASGIDAAMSAMDKAEERSMEGTLPCLMMQGLPQVR